MNLENDSDLGKPSGVVATYFVGLASSHARGKGDCLLARQGPEWEHRPCRGVWGGNSGETGKCALHFWINLPECKVTAGCYIVGERPCLDYWWGGYTHRMFDVVSMCVGRD